jgi:hypothetical protein
MLVMTLCGAIIISRIAFASIFETCKSVQGQEQNHCEKGGDGLCRGYCLTNITLLATNSNCKMCVKTRWPTLGCNRLPAPTNDAAFAVVGSCNTALGRCDCIYPDPTTRVVLVTCECQ